LFALKTFLRLVLSSLVLGLVVLGLAACAGIQPKNAKASQPIPQELQNRLASIGSSAGAPMMVRIFKQSNELEVWKQGSGGTFKLVKTYDICAWSGVLGPKVKEGDRQAPEGMYTITPGLMNPNSNYYLAFNTGFPNKFDRSWGRYGSNLMVHGACSSSGCYSMTDAAIAEIYALARETFRGGNPSFLLQVFPFRMTVDNLAKNADNPSLPFWKNIKEGYDRFEMTRQPPTWDVCEKKYVFGLPIVSSLDAQGNCPPSVAAAQSPELKSKLLADEAALEAKIAKASAAADAAAKAEAAAKARGEAIGSFIGGIFGAGSSGPVDPSIVPPVPATRPGQG
jgi:murein L,D-transpeptidase YafK